VKFFNNTVDFNIFLCKFKKGIIYNENIIICIRNNIFKKIRAWLLEPCPNLLINEELANHFILNYGFS